MTKNPESALAAGAPAAASVPSSTMPRLIQFGGTVTDATGKPIRGTVAVTFSLYARGV
jgi:hypothetical protein